MRVVLLERGFVLPYAFISDEVSIDDDQSCDRRPELTVSCDSDRPELTVSFDSEQTRVDSDEDQSPYRNTSFISLLAHQSAQEASKEKMLGK